MLPLLMPPPVPPPVPVPTTVPVPGGGPTFVPGVVMPLFAGAFPFLGIEPVEAEPPLGREFHTVLAVVLTVKAPAGRLLPSLAALGRVGV